MTTQNSGTCSDCGNAGPLTEYETDNLAGTKAVLLELCTDCYGARVPEDATNDN